MGNLSALGTIDTQTLVVYNNAQIYGAYSLEFGRNVAGKQTDAGKIGYQTFTAGYLDIIGAGTTIGSRNIKMSDNLTVVSTVTAASGNFTNSTVSGGFDATNPQMRGSTNFWNLSTGYIALIDNNTGSNWSKIQHNGSNVVVSTGSGNGSWDWQVTQATSAVRPRTDNTMNLGETSNRWKNVNAVNYVGTTLTLNGVRRDPAGVPYFHIGGGASVASGSSATVSWTTVLGSQNYAGVMNVAGSHMINDSSVTLVVRIDYWITWPSNGSGTRTVYLARASDNAYFAYQRITNVAAAGPYGQTGSSAVILTPGNYCELWISQDSGSTLTLDNAIYVMTVC